MNRDYDVIVVGTGHAGVEAALAAARMGCQTASFTLNRERIAYMPCNCSIGGPAKGHLAREVDALGGQMGINTDLSLTHIRRVGTGKGPAVQTLRAHADKSIYPQTMRRVMESQPHLALVENAVEGLLTHQNRIVGVKLADGSEVTAHAVIITTGTFLNGLCHLGEQKIEAARHGDPPVGGLSQSLRALGFRMGRFKTGTTPRLRKSSIDLTQMILIEPEEDSPPFSFKHARLEFARLLLPCWQTYTNERAHAVIQANLHRSAMYSGQIQGTGPRYCPSIEDKIHRFPEKRAHPIFLEQEYWDQEDLYVQGMSTSLPEETQMEILQAMPGMEQVEMIRAGYAVEYDMVYPDQLHLTLMAREVEGLFLAGQINGTSGYEEAAAQGLVAGINAALYAQNREPLVLERARSYIGVLIDDLVTKGVEDPYRMLTGRAEYRLTLRHDNADERLTPVGRAVGLVDDERWQRFTQKRHGIETETERLQSEFVSGKHNPWLQANGQSMVSDRVSAYDYLRRPGARYETLSALLGWENPAPSDVVEQIEINAKYEAYLKKQSQQVQQQQKLEHWRIPDDLDYHLLRAISKESREKLAKARPRTVGQAARVPGVRPADIHCLLVYLKKENGAFYSA
ncbi:MAG: tRNA uridine-5-carboxymethylaminomethyl(34) synthesis enzyme MnmG [Fimbriimonadia bacterium]|nr:tRNA uridine-5-carboxymethylaminomethyl(34) synthesis enzyme MnmG [Fimbriimonadia bacterium]